MNDEDHPILADLALTPVEDDPDRVVVARGGDTVQMSGEFQDSGRFAANPCDPESGQVAVVQSQIAITGR